MKNPPKGFELLCLENAIQTALEYENRIRDLYAKAIIDPALAAGKEFFTIMADEEQAHVDWLQDRLDEWRRDGLVSEQRLTSSVPSFVPPVSYAESLSQAATSVDQGHDSRISRELRCLEEALIAETEASIFYERLVKELPPTDAVLFEPFLEIEHRHRAFVEYQMDMVARLGWWWTGDTE